MHTRVRARMRMSSVHQQVYLVPRLRDYYAPIGSRVWLRDYIYLTTRRVTESWAPKVIYLILSEITGAYLGVSRIPGHATQASESDRPIFVKHPPSSDIASQSADSSPRNFHEHADGVLHAHNRHEALGRRLLSLLS